VPCAVNNFLYDCSLAALATDRVEPDYLAAPRHRVVDNLRRSVLRFGPLSPLFDYASFALPWSGPSAAHDPALLQTGWLVESMLPQSLIVYVLRTAAPPSLAKLPSPARLAATAPETGLEALPASSTAAPTIW
jgi:Mg2+-importing ATPase